MATNDWDVEPKEQAGPVATLTRIVHAAAHPNDQTPIRVVALVTASACMATAPMPWLVIGFIAILIVGLSLGQVTRR